ncbi:MAG: hypothetical protein HY908_24880 [Myxococcales bacterium]|nr:hypothetical protein [Myxococcales bacterium]
MRFVGARIESLRPIAVVEDWGGLEANGCDFIGFWVTGREGPAGLPCVHDVVLNGVRLRNCRLEGLRLQRVVVEDVTWPDIMIVQEVVLDDCVLRGKIGRLAIHALGNHRHTSRGIAAAYLRVGRALDISQARPLELDLTGIPSEKVTFDSDLAIAIRRARVESLPEWREFVDDRSGALLERMLHERWDDCIVTARHVDRGTLQSDRTLVRRLRALGLDAPADPEHVDEKPWKKCK